MMILFIIRAACLSKDYSDDNDDDDDDNDDINDDDDIYIKMYFNPLYMCS